MVGRQGDCFKGFVKFNSQPDIKFCYLKLFKPVMSVPRPDKSVHVYKYKIIYKWFM